MGTGPSRDDHRESTLPLPPRMPPIIPVPRDPSLVPIPVPRDPSLVPIPVPRDPPSVPIPLARPGPSVLPLPANRLE
ncbi:hypothetical protein SLE2022_242230 [Rubroshorea leprosula]